MYSSRIISIILIVGSIAIFGCSKKAAKATDDPTVTTLPTIDNIVGSYVGNLHYYYTDRVLTGPLGTSTTIDTITYADTFFVEKLSDGSSLSIHTNAVYGPHYTSYFAYYDSNNYVLATYSPITAQYLFFPENDSMSYNYKEIWPSGAEHPDVTISFTGRKGP